MNNENSNTKPDLNFILSQPDPQQPRNKTRKTILIGSVVIVLALAGLVAAASIFGSKPKSTGLDTTDPVAVTNSFMTYLQTADQANLASATKLVTPPEGMTADYVSASLGRLQGSIDFTNCQKSNSSNPNNDTSKLETIYVCPNKITPTEKVTLIVDTQKNQSGQVHVTAFKVKANA